MTNEYLNNIDPILNSSDSSQHSSPQPPPPHDTATSQAFSDEQHPLFPFTPSPERTTHLHLESPFARSPASAPPITNRHPSALHRPPLFGNSAPPASQHRQHHPAPDSPADIILPRLLSSIDSLNHLLNTLLVSVDDLTANQEKILHKISTPRHRSYSPAQSYSGRIPDTIDTSVAASPLPPRSVAEQSIAASVEQSVAASVAHSSHSVASAAAFHHLLEDQKNRTITIENLKFKMEDKPYLRAWLKRLLATVQSHRFFGYLVHSDGSFKLPPPTDYDKLFYNALYAALPDQLQSIVRLNNQLESSGVAVFLYLNKVAAPLTTNNQLADKLFDEMKNLRFDPKKSNIWEFGTSFAEAVEKLKGTIHEMSDEAILSRWILSLPSSIFHQLQHDFQDAGTLPPTWTRTGHISVLLDQTESYIQKHHPLMPTSASKPSGTPRIQIHHPPPTGFARRDAWKTFLTSKIGQPDFQSHVAKVTHANCCPFCLFTEQADKHHVLENCTYYGRIKDNNNNVSNAPSTNYFYLSSTPARLASISSDPRQQNRMYYDTGSTHVLGCHEKYFSTLHRYPSDSTQTLFLGDEKSTTKIDGYGTMLFQDEAGHSIRVPAFLATALPTNFYSAKIHLQYSQCTTFGSNATYKIKFPTFSITTKSADDFSFIISPSSATIPTFDCYAPRLHRMATRSSSRQVTFTLPPTTKPTPSPPPETIPDLTYESDSDSDSDDEVPTSEPKPETVPELTYASDSDSDSDDEDSISEPELTHASDSDSDSDDEDPISEPKPSMATNDQLHCAQQPAPVPLPVITNMDLLSHHHPANVFTHEANMDEESHKASRSIHESQANPSANEIYRSNPPPSFQIIYRHLRKNHQIHINHRIENDFHSLLPSLPTHHRITEFEDFVLRRLATDEIHRLHHTLLSNRLNSLCQSLAVPHDSNPPTQYTAPVTDPASSFQAQTANATPPLRPIDRVNSTIPNNVPFTIEHLQRCTGFRNIHTILPQIKEVCEGITVQNLGKDPIKSRGEVATMNKKRRNTTPVPRPDTFGDVFHYDIGYGAGTAIGGIRYALFLVDRKTRYKFVYPLSDLQGQTIKSQIQIFIRDIGKFPKEMICDRDFRLLGGEVDAFLSPHTITAGAPRNRQNQNGLSEANWRYICNIARNYLTEHLLPNKFWFHAIQYAVQVSNYLPIQTETHVTTSPHYEVYQTKPDYRKLLPLFSIAYVKEHYPGSSKQTFHSQTIKAILLGNDHKSDGQIFYNPATDSIIASADYTLDPTHPSGPLFNQVYDGGLQFHLYHPHAETSRPPQFDVQQNITIINHPDPEINTKAATIIKTPTKIDPTYSALLQDSSIVDLTAAQIRPIKVKKEINPILTIPWIQQNSKVTLLMEGEITPQQGYLHTSDNKWFFVRGRKHPNESKSTPQELPHFESSVKSLINSKSLRQGWIQYNTFLEDHSTAKSQQYLLRRMAFFQTTDPTIIRHPQQIVVRLSKISARDLISSTPPPSLKHHHKMHPNDKEIWDNAYLEEYLGLHETTHTWDYISEEEYQILRKEIGTALPTMAISKIKHDENGIPTRAKYRIVVLGNLDPHNWSAADCFAPVLSALETRLLTSIAAQFRTPLKSGDAVQAFCQSYLPENEKYILKPPANCPITPPNTYLLLRRTLYGLKRSPRHWYETAKREFAKIGIFPLPNAPCIFTGTPCPGEPPIYIGLYVDDFIYFSQSTTTEQTFETLIKQNTSLNVEFQGVVKHFLGLKFTHQSHPSGDLTIFINQEASADELLRSAGLDGPSTNSKPTPYRSGHPVDSIPDEDLPLYQKQRLQQLLQKYVGSLNWLSTQTRPDLATITNILAQHNANPSHGHIKAAKYAIQYLKGTKDLGIAFSSKPNTTMESFVKYPVDPSELLPMTDANWGPQDASQPNPNEPPPQLDLWKSRSISGFLIWLGGPVHWQSKRQSITARSSAESEIYAIDECTKSIQHITNILKDLDLFQIFTDGPIPIKNDNAAAVQWSYNMTSKGLRHIQMRENAVREQTILGLIQPEHQSGDTNLSDMFTKEDKDDAHFIAERDAILQVPPTTHLLHSTSSAAQATEGGIQNKEVMSPLTHSQPSSISFNSQS